MKELTRRTPSPFDEVPYLLHHISTILDKRYNTELESQLGIGVSQLKILHVLEQHPFSLQLFIARFLGQSESAVSRQVQALHETGYIKREKNPHDGRQRIICLTKAGSVILRESARIKTDCYQRVLESALTGTQLSRLRNELQGLHSGFCTASPSGCQQPAP